MIAHYVVLAARRSWRRPWTVVLAIVTLAVGIAAYMTTLTVFRALEGEPLPGISDALYVVTMDARETGDATGRGRGDHQPQSLLKLRDAAALVDAHGAQSQIAVATATPQISSLDGTRSTVSFGYMAYGPVLQVLGVPLRFGRGWTAAEQAMRVPVAVIDTGLAQRIFGTQNAVGRTVRIGERSFRVVGVTAPWRPRVPFVDASSGVVEGFPVQLFLPLEAALDAGIGPASSGICADHGSAPTFGSVDVQHCRWLEVWVSLTSAAARAGYSALVTQYAAKQHDAGRFADPPRAQIYRTQAWLAVNRVVPGDVQLNLIMAASFLALCIVNVTGLLAARLMHRQPDVAIRRALGASWRQVLLQHLIECGLVGVLGGVLALPLTWLGMWIVRQQLVTYASAAQPGWGALWLLLATSVIVGLLVGVLPAWRACRLPPASLIRQSA